MKLIIHDIAAFENSFTNVPEASLVVSEDNTFNNCIGCFGCWLKTPGTCVIRDKYGDIGEALARCEEVIIISKCFYGGYSPFVKKVLDRGISYSHPYFETRNGEMHHKCRYYNNLKLNVWFYGEGMTEEEKATAEKLVKANAINLNCSGHKVAFVQEIAAIDISL